MTRKLGHSVSNHISFVFLNATGKKREEKITTKKIPKKTPKTKPQKQTPVKENTYCH